MPKTALLHIGSHKTGTSSIQKALAAYDFSGSPVCYPLTAKGDRLNVGHSLQDPLTPLYIPTSEWEPIWFEKYYGSGPRFASLCRRYRSFLFGKLQSAQHAILSNEDLSYFSAASVRRLRDDLEGVGFEKFHIVLYVRDPADYFLSMLHSVLKLSLGVGPTGHDPASFHYEFLKTADTWERAFPGRVEVRHYRNDPDFDVVGDFSDVVDRRLGVTLRLQSVRANTSLSAEGLQLMQDYRRAFWPDNGGAATPDAVRLYWILARPAPDLPQTKAVLKAAVAEHIRANHTADADELRARYGIDLGLRDVNPRVELQPGQAVNVRDLVESIDPDVVYRLMLHVARATLSDPPAPRRLSTRIASRARRTMQSVRGANGT